MNARMDAPDLAATDWVLYDTDPSKYRHWQLAVDGAIATLTLDVNEERGLRPGYRLKLNSYDLGVDMELHDALQRIRFEHPQVNCVVMTSAKERMFCSGANIYMLGLSSHAWKVNFCKFTNETRNGIEDTSRHSGIRFVAALNGITAGGGYELALACDEIIMIDDRASTVSLPEVPLLGVLPGTGGLTRITDKRKVRRDLADMFCTTTEGVRADRALEWKLVDRIAKPQVFAQVVRDRANQCAAAGTRPAGQAGVTLTPLTRTIDARGIHYQYIDAIVHRQSRTVTITVSAPTSTVAHEIADIEQVGVNWWPLQMARELDDCILLLRTNELDQGTWLWKTNGDMARVMETDRTLLKHKDHWFVREVIGMLRRTLARLETSSRTQFAVIDQGSAFAGTLLELALAADRGYMLRLPEGGAQAPRLILSEANFGLYPAVHGQGRLQSRCYDNREMLTALRARVGEPLDAAQALELGLITVAPDDLDWEDEVRLAVEERASLSPDALTGLEASLRFNTGETMATRIFGRLSAWQNWIFSRPNAVGDEGALKVFGTGKKARFKWERI